MSGALYHAPDRSVLYYSCKTGTTFLTKCRLCHLGRCDCTGMYLRFGEHLDLSRVDMDSIEIYRAVVRDPVERAISAFQHCALRCFFPDRREAFVNRGGDNHWKTGELEIVQAWRQRHLVQLQRYTVGEHPDDIVDLWMDWAETVLPVVMIKNCHFQPQLHHDYTQPYLDRCELWVTPKLTVEMHRHYPQYGWHQRSTHRGGWYFNISRSNFYNSISAVVRQYYAADFELYDRAVEHNLHKYPGLRKTR